MSRREGPHDGPDALAAILEGMGLSERLPAFRAQRIAPDHLPELTDADLRELGLTIGERKSFRRAVERRAMNRTTAAEGDASPALMERRPLTVMFVDMVDSTGLSERLDPEDLLEVIRRYRELCGAAIARVGGQVARLIGDGILAYFCYPVAHENDTERAVRAALEIQTEIGDLETPADQPLRVRIGIATGRVVIGDLFAGGTTDKRGVVGATPNLAARLQSLAQPEGVVVAEETWERVRHLFAFEDLGTHELRGFHAPIRSFRVLRALPDRTQGRARLTPFFGRGAELGVLDERWLRATSGEGSVVLLEGEPGIGKSRLTERFLVAREEEGARIVALAASALDQDSALHPVAAWLRANDAADVRLDLDEEAEALTGALLGRFLPERLAQWPPARLRAATLDVVERVLLAGATPGPLCLVIEDLHWLDPTSAELLNRLVDAITERPVLLLLTARDGYVAEWTTKRQTTVLRLSRLGGDDIAGMVRSLFQERPLSASLSRQIARRTDGVPLYVEEFVRTLLLRNPDATVTLDEDGAEIPASLHDSLMARLDRSGVAKQIAQAASVVGRSVRRDLLAEVAGLPETLLEEPLATLLSSGVMQPEEDDDDGKTWRFGHALLRDAAYDSLLRERRRELHVRVARALPRLMPEVVAAQPEALALHLSEGGLAEEAVEHWLAAGRRACSRSALQEATRLLRRGLGCVATLPPTPTTMRQRLDLIVLLGPALISLEGPNSEQAQTLYADAYEFCRNLPEAREHFPVYWGWWRVSRDIRVKLERSKTMLGRAERRGDAGLLLQAHHCSWASRFSAGDLCGCREHISAGLRIYAAGDHADHASLYGNHDAGVCAHGNLSLVAWMQGDTAAATAEEARTAALVESLGHLGSRVHAMDTALQHRVYRRDAAAVRARADALIAVASDHGLSDHGSKGLIYRGWAMMMMGDTRAGLHAIEEGFGRQREIGTMEDFPLYFCLLAEAMIAADKAEHAVEMLLRAEAELAATHVTHWSSEVRRMRGMVMLGADPASVQAEAVLNEAIGLAELQGAWLLALRGACSLAELLYARDAAEAARTVLHAARARLAGAPTCPDVAAADALAAVLNGLPMPQRAT